MIVLSKAGSIEHEVDEQRDDRENDQKLKQSSGQGSSSHAEAEAISSQHDECVILKVCKVKWLA